MRHDRIAGLVGLSSAAASEQAKDSHNHSAKLGGSTSTSKTSKSRPNRQRGPARQNQLLARVRAKRMALGLDIFSPNGEETAKAEKFIGLKVLFREGIASIACNG